MTEVPPSAGPHTASDKSQLSIETFTTVFPSLPPLHWRAWWEQPARKVRGKSSSWGKLSAAVTVGGCSHEHQWPGSSLQANTLLLTLSTLSFYNELDWKFDFFLFLFIICAPSQKTKSSVLPAPCWDSFEDALQMVRPWTALTQGDSISQQCSKKEKGKRKEIEKKGKHCPFQ